MNRHKTFEGSACTILLLNYRNTDRYTLFGLKGAALCRVFRTQPPTAAAFPFASHISSTTARPKIITGVPSLPLTVVASPCTHPPGFRGSAYMFLPLLVVYPISEVLPQVQAWTNYELSHHRQTNGSYQSICISRPCPSRGNFHSQVPLRLRSVAGVWPPPRSSARGRRSSRY